MQEGEIVLVKVTGIKEYGAFVQAGEYSGLIHISEFSDSFVKNINDIVSIGEEVSACVLEVNEEEKKIKLSYKKANLLPSKIYQNVKVVKGFNSLAVKFDKWINNKNK